MEQTISLLRKELDKYHVSEHIADTGSAYFRIPLLLTDKVKMIRVGNHNGNSNRGKVWEIRSDAMTKRYKNGRRIYNIRDVKQMLIDLEKVIT